MDLDLFSVCNSLVNVLTGLAFYDLVLYIGSRDV